MIAIIIVHTGKSYYLKPIIEQARIYNPNTAIYLISDSSTKSLEVNDLCTHINIEEYKNSANRFKEIYTHKSSNSYEFELFCFMRWFIIRDFVLENSIESFVCIDSDFLLFDEVDKFLTPFLEKDFTICDECLPNCTLFSDSSIQKFCAFIESMYLNPKIVNELDAVFANYKLSGELGGICDMTAFTWYQKYNSNTTANISIPHNGVAVDDCYYKSSGYCIDKKSKQLIVGRIPKLILWKNDLPYGIYENNNELVRFAGIHLQGGAKRIIYKFLVDKNKKRKNGFFYTISWLLKPQIFNYRIKRVINKIKLIIENNIR